MQSLHAGMPRCGTLQGAARLQQRQPQQRWQRARSNQPPNQPPKRSSERLSSPCRAALGLPDLTRFVPTNSTFLIPTNNATDALLEAMVRGGWGLRRGSRAAAG